MDFFTHDTLRSCRRRLVILNTPSCQPSRRIPTKISPRPWMKVVCAVPFRNSDVACPWRANSHIDKPALIADYNPETRRGHWSREEPSDLCIPDYWQSGCRHESNRFPPFLDFRRFPPYLHRPACLTSTRLRHCFLKQRQRNLIKRMRVLITRCFVLSTTEKYLSVLEQDRKVDQSSIVVRAKSQNTHTREIRCIRSRITLNRSIVSSIEIQFVREDLRLEKLLVQDQRNKEERVLKT